MFNYTTPRNKWELQQWNQDYILGMIIPHQEINGNYNSPVNFLPPELIIPHQEINGNYN